MCGSLTFQAFLLYCGLLRLYLSEGMRTASFCWPTSENPLYCIWTKLCVSTSWKGQHFAADMRLAEIDSRFRRLAQSGLVQSGHWSSDCCKVCKVGEECWWCMGMTMYDLWENHSRLSNEQCVLIFPSQEKRLTATTMDHRSLRSLVPVVLSPWGPWSILLGSLEALGPRPEMILQSS